MKSIIKESTINKTAKIYKNVRICKSTISGGASIGDDCDILNSTMFENSEFGRRNIIRNSTIGIGSYTGTNVTLKNVDVGNFSSISWNVSIGGMNHNMEYVTTYTNEMFNKILGLSSSSKIKREKRTIIGNDVWIGNGAIILEGIKIGDGAIIGAGSVVTKDIDPYCIVAGVPAKIIRMRFSKEIIESLLDIKWWNWDRNKIVNNLKLLNSIPNIKKLKKLSKK